MINLFNQMKKIVVIVSVITFSINGKTNSQETNLKMNYNPTGQQISKTVVPPKGVLRAYPKFLFFSKKGGDSIIILRNLGGTSFTWQLDYNPTWVSINKKSGTLNSSGQPLNAGDTLKVTCEANTSNAIRTDTITFSSKDASVLESPYKIVVIQSDITKVIDEQKSNQGTINMIQFGNTYLSLITNSNELIQDVLIYDYRGALIEQFNNIKKNQLEIPINAFSSSIYFLIIKLDQNLFVMKKFILLK